MSGIGITVGRWSERTGVGGRVTGPARTFLRHSVERRL